MTDIKKFINISQPLKKKPQWILFKKVWSDKRKKFDKIPYQTNGYKASPTNPKHWSKFEDVVMAYQVGGFDGIGYVFKKDDGITGIDIDGCINEKGNIHPDVKKIIKDFESYTEYSISKKGIHILCYGKKPGTHCKKALPDYEIEIYDHGRYFVMTGDVLTPENL